MAEYGTRAALSRGTGNPPRCRHRTSILASPRQRWAAIDAAPRDRRPAFNLAAFAARAFSSTTSTPAVGPAILRDAMQLIHASCGGIGPSTVVNSMLVKAIAGGRDRPTQSASRHGTTASHRCRTSRCAVGTSWRAHDPADWARIDRRMTAAVTATRRDAEQREARAMPANAHCDDYRRRPGTDRSNYGSRGRAPPDTSFNSQDGGAELRR